MFKIFYGLLWKFLQRIFQKSFHRIQKKFFQRVHYILELTTKILPWEIFSKTSLKNLLKFVHELLGIPSRKSTPGSSARILQDYLACLRDSFMIFSEIIPQFTSEISLEIHSKVFKNVFENLLWTLQLILHGFFVKSVWWCFYEILQELQPKIRISDFSSHKMFSK